MAGESSNNKPLPPTSPSLAGFNTDQLPFSTSQNSENFTNEKAVVDPRIIKEEPEEEEEEEDGADLFNDNYLADYQQMDGHDQYESYELDERDLDQILLGRRAAESLLDVGEAETLIKPLSLV